MLKPKTFLEKYGKIIAVTVAALALLGGGVYMLFLKPPPPPPVVSITPEAPAVTIDETVKLTVKTEPEDAAKKMKWTWASSDENIATTSNNGVVTGKKPGSVAITVTSEKDKTVSASVQVTIVPIPIPEPELTSESVKPTQPKPPQPKPSNGSGYSFGKYEGKLVNGIPDGQGTMYYTCRVQIAKHGRNTYYAEKGDTFVGTWGNGDIVNGNLYDSNNNQKAAILAGKRPNPYDLKNDKCE